jgi:hypothetical protein
MNLTTLPHSVSTLRITGAKPLSPLYVLFINLQDVMTKYYNMNVNSMLRMLLTYVNWFWYPSWNGR